MSYSQNDEERFILAACQEDCGQFLDLGAWNATDKSNTRALFLKGWGGVLIEPSPGPFLGLCQEYGPFERIALIRAAVTLDPVPEVEMYISEDAVSTTEQANYEKWKDHAPFEKNKVKVPAVTLERIFAEHGDFDFVSIDAEGTSVDLLDRLFHLGKRPQCVCVEHDGRTTEVLAVATGLGYACTYANGENLVLVR